MKITFEDYTYFDGDSNDKNTYNSPSEQQQADYKFNKSYFNQLVSNRQYNDAADYASKYHFSDPEKESKLRNHIRNLKRDGRMLGAIYSRIEDPDKLAQIEFYDKVFVDGGLEMLGKDNKYANDFIKWKKMLGSENSYRPDGTGTGKEATSLSITFAGAKLVDSLTGWDWMAKDNQNTIENFYETSGLSERELKNAGVKIDHKDGNTTLTFSKSSGIANKIISNIPNKYYSTGLWDDATGGIGWVNVDIRGYDKDGKELETSSSMGGYDCKMLINDARNTKENYFSKTDIDKKQYSSTIGPAIDDNLTALREALNAGEIDETTYNKQAKIVGGYVYDAIKSLGSGHYEMYTNFFNEKATDETLVSAENEQRANLASLMAATSPKDMELLSMCSNGKIGTLVVINPSDLTDSQKKALGDNPKIDELYNGKRIQIFIPGLMQEQAQQKINNDSGCRVAQELNSMLDYDYDYTCLNGTKIAPDGAGGFTINGKKCDKEKAALYVERDMLLDDALGKLKYDYLTFNGNMISTKDNSMAGAEAYEQASRLAAVTIANQIMPGVQVNKVDGTPYTIDEIFNMKGISTSNDVFDEENGEISQSLQYEVANKISHIYYVYDKLMSELSYYDIDPDFKIKK